MNIIDAIILGILQGFTEFLPISSSGHLVLGQKLLGIHVPGNTLEVILHIGTLFSIIFVFWKDIVSIFKNLKQSETQKFVGLLILGTIPAVVIGLFFKDSIEVFFDSSKIVGFMLLVTAALLFLTRFVNKNDKEINWKSSFAIGLAQAFAILPGVSRSGSTISIAMMLGISPSKAARFSFLLAIPALIGAGLLTALDIDTIQVSTNVLIVGFFSSFLSGWIALKWLLGLLKSGKFYWFGFYCLIVGLITIGF